jgi:tRNA threonylcarbamoyladenosine biosynthesis protein TsaE
MTATSSDMPSCVQLRLDDESATARAGALIGPHLGGGAVITLDGELGAGKTTLVRGLLRAVGVEGPVKSPTYALVEDYAISSLYFYHFDFYRFDDPAEWECAGFAEYFRADAVCLVEWPARVAGFLPVPDLALTLLHLPAPAAGRMLLARAHSRIGEECLASLSGGFAAIQSA